MTQAGRSLYTFCPSLASADHILFYCWLVIGRAQRSREKTRPVFILTKSATFPPRGPSILKMQQHSSARGHLRCHVFGEAKAGNPLSPLFFPHTWHVSQRGRQLLPTPAAPWANSRATPSHKCHRRQQSVFCLLLIMPLHFIKSRL